MGFDLVTISFFGEVSARYMAQADDGKANNKYKSGYNCVSSEENPERFGKLNGPKWGRGFEPRGSLSG